MDPLLGYVIVSVGAALVMLVMGVFLVVMQRTRKHLWRAEEQRLAVWAEQLDREQEALAVCRAELSSVEATINQTQAAATALHAQAAVEKERIAGLTAEQARDEVLSTARYDARAAAAAVTREIEESARTDGTRRARAIMVGAMERLAAEATADATVVTVALPTDEMKGRLIGREGRNIRTFEQLTEVDLLVDDTPGSVVLSCFDPVRRERARLTLTSLIEDGRVHQASIEDAYARAVREVDEANLQAASEAVAKLGIGDLNPELLKTLGILRLRTSYGQSVLAHSVECGHLAALMAGELGCDVDTCRRAAFLHDLGKALTGKTDTPHAEAGAALARRYGESDDVVHAIEAHHNEIEPQSVEAVLVQVADAISSSRPGARRESAELHLERLRRLESIAAAQPGVERVFAVKAGREVRIMVQPTEVDDAQAVVIADEVAKRIETELSYPGSIKVTVIRESRATALAR